MRRAAIACTLAALLQPVEASAATLSITKSAKIVSDPVGTAAPKSLPGALVDYTVLFTNPLGNAGLPVRNIAVTDTLPADVVLRVSDLGATGTGPVQFTDGSLLGLGLLGSGLTCTFVSLASTTDCIDFSSDGTSWTYTPVPDADGFDAKVRAIRVRPAVTFATGGSFQLRYRARIR